jgi:hypothetical protein
MANRYQNIKVVKLDRTSTQYYTNNLYPDIAPKDSDNYIIAVLGDRFDLIANDFYQDPSLWWIIPAANNLPGDSIFATPGMQLRIPSDIQTILNSYNRENNG